MAETWLELGGKRKTRGDQFSAYTRTARTGGGGCSAGATGENFAPELGKRVDDYRGKARGRVPFPDLIRSDVIAIDAVRKGRSERIDEAV